MFKLNAVQVRHYELENPDDGTTLHIKPPSLETLEMFNKVFSTGNTSPKDAAGIMATILSNNEENLKISARTVMRWCNMDTMSALVEDFLGWVNDTKKSNPN